MWNILSFIKKNLIVSIMISMVLGLVIGFYFNLSKLQSLILPLTMLMIFPMMVNLKLKEILELKKFKLILTALIVNFTILPFVSYFVGNLFFENTNYILAFVIMGSLPTSGMTISWTGFAGGNVKDSVKITILSLFLGSILMPLYIRIFLGTTVSISILNVLRQISLVILVPLILGIITRKFIIKTYGKESFEKIWKRKLPLLSGFGLVLVIFISMGLKAKNIIGNPMEILNLIMPIIVLYFSSFTISSVIGKLMFCRKDSLALVYGTALRNLSIAMGLSVAIFKDQAPPIIMVLSIAYIFQVQASAWYLKLSKVILKKGSLLTKKVCTE